MQQQHKWISVFTVGISLIFALGASSVIAHGPGHDDDHGHDGCEHCEKKIAKMDTDGDGQISRREFMQYHGKKFDKYDLNDDRFLDADEIHYMMEDMHERMRKHMKKHQHGDGHGHGHGHGDEHKHGHDHEHDDDHDDEEDSPHGSHGDATHGDDEDDSHAH